MKDTTNKKIWLYAPLETRAQRSAGRDGIPIERAKEEIKKRENIERREFKRLYGLDYFDQKKYADLVIDNSNLEIRETVKKIIDFLRKKSFNY